MGRERGGRREYFNIVEKRRILLAGLLVFTSGCNVTEEKKEQVLVTETHVAFQTDTPHPISTQQPTTTPTPIPTPTKTSIPTATNTPLPEYLRIIPQTDKVGLIGTYLLNERDLPRDVMIKAPPENIEAYRFKDGSGNPLEYGYFRDVTSDGLMYRVYVHAQFRTILNDLPDRTGLGGSKYFLLEVPYEGSNRQFLLGFTPNQYVAPTNAYLVNEDAESPKARVMSYADILKAIERMPDGASIIVGISIHHSYDSEEELYRNQEIVNFLKDEELINTPYLFAVNIDDYYLDVRFVED